MDEKGIPVLVTINIRRLKSPEEISKMDLSNCPIEEQPIPRGHTGGKLAFSGIGAAGIAIGLIGGVVGSLVRLKAGPGSAVGAAVGTAAAAVAIYSIVKTTILIYKSRKEEEKQKMAKKEHSQKTQKEKVIVVPLCYYCHISY